jgi:hypothetical protein
MGVRFPPPAPLEKSKTCCINGGKASVQAEAFPFFISAAPQPAGLLSNAPAKDPDTKY